MTPPVAADHRRVGLRRGRRDPGRPEDVRGARASTAPACITALTAQNTLGVTRDAPRPARRRGGAARRGARRPAGGRGQDRHARRPPAIAALVAATRAGRAARTSSSTRCSSPPAAAALFDGTCVTPVERAAPARHRRDAELARRPAALLGRPVTVATVDDGRSGGAGARRAGAALGRRQGRSPRRGRAAPSTSSGTTVPSTLLRGAPVDTANNHGTGLHVRRRRSRCGSPSATPVPRRCARPRSTSTARWPASRGLASWARARAAEPLRLVPARRQGMRFVHAMEDMSARCTSRVAAGYPGAVRRGRADAAATRRSGSTTRPGRAATRRSGCRRCAGRWIAERGDVAPSRRGHGDRRQVRGRRPTQLHYARQGIVTPEMEFVGDPRGRRPASSSATRSPPAGRCCPPTSTTRRPSR